MSWNPYVDAAEKDEEVAQDFALDLGLVTEYVEPEEGEDKHQAIVRVLSPETFEPISAPEPVDISIGIRGDITIPKPNTVVIIGYVRGMKPIILDSLYTRQDTKRDYINGDRIVGHDQTDSALFINDAENPNQTGEVEIESVRSDLATIDTEATMEFDYEGGITLTSSPDTPILDSTVEMKPDGSVVVTSNEGSSKAEVKANGDVVVESEDANSKVEVKSDGTVVINDGNTQPMMDISFGTDGDGHYISHTITRADGIYMPSQ